MRWIPLLLPIAIISWAETNQDDLSQTKNALVATEEVERQILGTLYSINSRMKDMSKKRDRMTDRMLASSSDIQKLASSIEAIEAKVDEQRQGLRSGLKSLYELRGTSILRTLFSNHSGQELGKSLKYLKLVSDRGYQLIKDYEKGLRTLKLQRRQLDLEVQRLAKLQSAFKRQEDALAFEQKSKGSLLEKLKIQQNHQYNKLVELRKSNPATEVNLGFFEKKGSLKAPVSAVVHKGYGYLQDETYRFRLAHKGVFYLANPQTKVNGVFAGKVAFSGEVPGYGITTIIDHGDHYYTVYGFLSKAEVQRGETIKEGQIIGLAGGRSPWYGDGLYFEIRHFSDPIDPQPWLQQL